MIDELFREIVRCTELFREIARCTDADVNTVADDDIGRDGDGGDCYQHCDLCY